MREAFARHSGYEVDYEGDAFFYAFASASGGSLPRSVGGDGGPRRWRSRSGSASTRAIPSLDPPKYVGMDVHTAARIMSSAHGGQVVAPSSTAGARRRRPQRARRAPAEGHRGPSRLLPAGRRRFPPLKTISNTNLPRPASSFVGRGRARRGALARSTGARLLTLTGPGGTGKTRLAIEARFALVPEYKAGVFWVGLASLRDAALVTETIAQSRAPRTGSPSTSRAGAAAPARQPRAGDRGRRSRRFSSACPNLTLLVTTRELLRVQGEVEYPVPPLAEPEAVSLFCERARSSPPRRSPSSARASTRSRSRSSWRRAHEGALADADPRAPVPGLDLLKGGRDADPRQQTLRATIEWSYDLLSLRGAAALRPSLRLRGRLHAGGREERRDADLDTLQSLVEKSLLRFSTSATGCSRRSASTPGSGSTRRASRTSCDDGTRSTSGGSPSERRRCWRG